MNYLFNIDPQIEYYQTGLRIKDQTTDMLVLYQHIETIRYHTRNISQNLTDDLDAITVESRITIVTSSGQKILIIFPDEMLHVYERMITYIFPPKI